jgi:bifunctional non-homologous end joining protein LigD
MVLGMGRLLGKVLIVPLFAPVTNDMPGPQHRKLERLRTATIGGMARKRARGAPFTVETPRSLPVERDGEHWWLEDGGRRLRLSNLPKVYWPGDGYTKGDLLAYYWNAADLILPYLAGRPLTMRRMPDGIEGGEFYEKNAPSHTPDWMPRCPVEDEDSDKVIRYLMVDDPVSLLYVANLGAIEFHPLHSRCDSIQRPDYLFFDLDPFPPITFDDVRAVARHVRAALDALGIPSYPKTSGATGMQIYVGLQPGPGYEQARAFVGAIGRMILRADPDRVTMEWDVSKRAGKVFIDHNMVRRGANIAAAYSVRPVPGANVSAPVTWDEVEGGIEPGDVTIANAHERFARVGDLFRPVLEELVDLRPALEKLGLPAEPETTDSHAAPAAPGAAEERLARYEEMRDFEATPEPPPDPVAGSGNSFVIQKHDATRLHYDLRLEHDGTLPSWAVPRGLPIRPGERRLAVRTEDHPLEYGSFEGWIPEGQYGAGEVRIFDRGTYDLLEWTDEKVSFHLHGHRHRGEYHLIKTDRDWLVFLSKRSTDEQPPDPPSFSPMLADPGHEPFDDPGWRFEPKLDGIRTLAYVATEGTRLVSRTGRDQTDRYPELDNLARFVNALQAVLDGEIVTADEDGRPSFERLQQRMNLTASADIEKARRRIPVQLYAFDILWLDGRDLTGEPLEERRRLLEEIVTVTGPMHLTFAVEGEGARLFESAKQLGYEGVVAKKLGSRYAPGRRSREWRKVKALRRQDCVILGWTPGERSRASTLGALLVGAYDEGELRWIGQVGTGFTEGTLRDLLDRLRGLETEEPVVDDPELRKVKGARWVRPELVCVVEYLQITTVGKLRAPSFKGLRDDKAPEDCLLERPV